MELVEVFLTHPHRQGFQAVLDKPAALVQRNRRIVAGGDGQLDQLEARVFARLNERRLDQSAAQTFL